MLYRLQSLRGHAINTAEVAPLSDGYAHIINCALKTIPENVDFFFFFTGLLAGSFSSSCNLLLALWASCDLGYFSINCSRITFPLFLSPISIKERACFIKGGRGFPPLWGIFSGVSHTRRSPPRNPSHHSRSLKSRNRHFQQAGPLEILL